MTNFMHHTALKQLLFGYLSQIFVVQRMFPSHQQLKKLLYLTFLCATLAIISFPLSAQKAESAERLMGKIANRNFAQGDSLIKAGDLVNAMIHFSEALELYEYLYGKYSPRMIGIYDILGRLLADEGYIHEAIPVVEKALYSLSLQAKTVPQISASLYLLMGKLYQQKGLGTAALPYFLQTLRLYSENPDIVSPENMLVLQMETGTLYLEQKKFLQAKATYQDALAYLLKFTPELNHNVAFIHRFLGMVYIHTDSVDQAQFHLHKALKLTRKIYKEKAQETADAYSSLSALHFRNGQFDSASIYADQVLKVYGQMEEKHEQELADYQLFLAEQYFLANAFTSSASWYKRYFDLKSSLTADSLSQSSLTLQSVDIADKFADALIYHEAFYFYELAYDFHTDHFGEQSAKTIRYLLHLAGIYQEIGDGERAQDRYEKALVLQKMQEKADTLRLRQTYINLAKLHAVNQEFILSNERYASALLILPTMGNQKADIYHHVALNHYLLNQFDSAMHYASLEAAFYREVYDGVHINMASSLLLLGNIYHALSRTEEAMSLFAQGMTQDPSALLEVDWVSMEANRLLSEIYEDIGKPQKSKWHALRAQEIRKKINR